MKIKEGFILREIGGSFVVVAVGNASKHFKGVIKLNDSGAFLWQKLETGNFNCEELAKELQNQYDVDEVTAKNDVNEFINNLKEAKIIE